MKNLVFFIFLLSFFLLAGCSHLPSNSREISSLDKSCLELVTQVLKKDALKYSKSDLEEKLLAVHLTDRFPKGGVIEAYSYDRPRFASTLHFSLGEPVLSHDFGNWEKRKFAILLPLKFLKDQMLNIYAQDTFILGSLKLPPEAIILVPKGEVIPTGFPGRVIEYENMSIREAAKVQIKAEKGITIETTEIYDEESILVDGQTIDPLNFFDPFLKENPNLTHMFHSNSFIGVMDLRVYHLIGAWYRRRESTYSTNAQYIKEILVVLKEALLKTEDVKKSLRLSAVAEDNYKKNKLALNGIMNLLEAEIILQTKYNKSFLNSKNVLRDEIWERRGNKKKLAKFLAENLDQFEAYAGEIYQASLKAFINNSEGWISPARMKKAIFEEPAFSGVSVAQKYASFFEYLMNSRAKAVLKGKDVISLDEVASVMDGAISVYEEGWQFASLAKYFSKIESLKDRKYVYKRLKNKEKLKKNLGKESFDVLFLEKKKE